MGCLIKFGQRKIVFVASGLSYEILQFKKKSQRMNIYTNVKIP